mgnify:FL=1
MKTKNAMQLKAMIKKVAAAKNVPPQLAMQNYMLERILARIEKSPYKKNFIVKGGFLIGSMVGVESRTTMDLDTTIRGVGLTDENLQEIFEKICKVDVDDDMTFSVEIISEIRDSDEYPGLRLHLKAAYEKMSVPLTIDVTTGDIITPAAVVLGIPTMFDEGMIEVYSYNLETILAEKLETIISRSEANTRPRDFYDIYLLSKLRLNECNVPVLKLALEMTSRKRGSYDVVMRWNDTIIKIESSEFLKMNWQKYCKTNTFAAGITYEQTCDAVKKLMELIETVR